MNCKNKSCKNCNPYTSGKYVRYTGVNIDTPFVFNTNSSFNDFVSVVTNYLAGLNPITYTLTIATTPPNATITINGNVTNTLVGVPGTVADVEISLSGYEPVSQTYYIGNQNQTVDVNLVPIVSNVTITFNSNPSGAVITVNGSNTNTFTGAPGTVVALTANLVGYLPYTENYTVPSSSQTHTLNLVVDNSFLYYWGEIGNIYAANPSGITQLNWDTYIKPNGTGNNMDDNVGVLLDNYEKDSTGNPLQWWIILVPTSETAVVNDLPNYTWYTWDTITSAWYEFTESAPLTGTVTLDSISYTYVAIRPNASNKIKYSKL